MSQWSMNQVTLLFGRFLKGGKKSIKWPVISLNASLILIAISLALPPLRSCVGFFSSLSLSKIKDKYKSQNTNISLQDISYPLNQDGVTLKPSFVGIRWRLPWVNLLLKTLPLFLSQRKQEREHNNMVISFQDPQRICKTSAGSWFNLSAIVMRPPRWYLPSLRKKSDHHYPWKPELPSEESWGGIKFQSLLQFFQHWNLPELKVIQKWWGIWSCLK